MADQPSDRARKAARQAYITTTGSEPNGGPPETLIQAFATFERETFAAGVEAAAKCAEAVKCEYMINAGEREMRERIITAIRNLTPAPPASDLCADIAQKSGEGLDTDALVEATEIYGWRSRSGTVYSGEGYPAPLRKFILDSQNAVALFVKPIRPTLDAERAKWREWWAKVAECHSDDRPRRDSMDWNDGFIDGCRGAADAIRSGAYRSDERG